MPRTFEGLGLSLLYPDNWRVDDREASSVTFEAPDGSLMSVTRIPDPEQCADIIQRMSQAMAQEYEEVETEKVQRTVGDALLEGVTQRFFYLDLLIASQLLTLLCKHHAWLIHLQAEDREMEKLELVFDAIITQIVQQSEDPASGS